MSDQQTAADVAALSRWFRSPVGPLHAELKTGSISLVEYGDVPTLRRLLTILDGPESGLKQLELFESRQAVREVRALFRAYRRVRRMEQRRRAASRETEHVPSGDRPERTLERPGGQPDGLPEL